MLETGETSQQSKFMISCELTFNAKRRDGHSRGEGCGQIPVRQPDQVHSRVNFLAHRGEFLSPTGQNMVKKGHNAEFSLQFGRKGPK